MKKENKQLNNWEQEFSDKLAEILEEEFPIHDDGKTIPVWNWSDFENIKNFIRQLLQKQTMELEEQIFLDGFNQAIDEILNLLQESRKEK